MIKQLTAEALNESTNSKNNKELVEKIFAAQNSSHDPMDNWLVTYYFPDPYLVEKEMKRVVDSYNNNIAKAHLMQKNFE